jgi:hypothetical protein
MAYRYRSRRSVKRIARKSRNNFIITLVIIGFLIYATINWILPFFINGLGIIKNTVQPVKKITQTNENSFLAPPVLNIPYEATNSSEINIRGFGSVNSKVKIFIDDEEKVTVDVSSDGSFSADNIFLSLGINNIYGKTIDEGNKESLPSKTIRIIYDFEKPNLSVSQPEDGKKIQGGDRKVTVSGKTEAGAKIYINGSQTVVDQDGNFTLDQPLNDGDNTITIKAVDMASNATEIQRVINYTP